VSTSYRRWAERRCSSESVEDAVDDVVADADARPGDDRLAEPSAKEPLQRPTAGRCRLLVLRLIGGLVLGWLRGLVLRRLRVLGSWRVVRRRLGGRDMVVDQGVNRLQELRGGALLVADR
jgi:hypothetical protein